MKRNRFSESPLLVQTPKVNIPLQTRATEDRNRSRKRVQKVFTSTGEKGSNGTHTDTHRHTQTRTDMLIEVRLRTLHLFYVGFLIYLLVRTNITGLRTKEYPWLPHHPPPGTGRPTCLLAPPAARRRGPVSQAIRVLS